MTAELPRVLVISHNPFSDTQNNGKTLSAFFAGWPPQQLAQLYFTMDTPDFTVCDRFFRITDLDMLKKAFGRPATSSGRITQAGRAQLGVQKSNLHRSRAYRLVRDIFQARLPSALLARSAFWTRSRWQTAELTRWLDDFDPQVVFFQSSNCTFAFDIVQTISDERGIPLVMETTDDYVTWYPSISPAAWLYHRSIERAYAAAVNRASTVFAIGGRMAEEYQRRFGGSWRTAMNSVDVAEPPIESGPAPDRVEPLILHFAGNVGLNRWQVLAAIGNALAELRERHGRQAKLEVYSLQEPDAKVLAALDIPGHCEFLGARDSEFLAKRRRASHFLVHVESFDRKNRRVARLSISTKIPEYMAAGRDILAVGPADVASIDYLSSEQAGTVVTSADPRQIAEAIESAVADPERLAAQRRTAHQLVLANHLKSAIAADIQEAIVAAVSGQ